MNTVKKDFQDLNLAGHDFLQEYSWQKFRDTVLENFEVIEARDNSIRFNSVIQVLKRLGPANFEKTLLKVIVKSDFHSKKVRHALTFNNSEEAHYYLIYGIIQHIREYKKLANEADDIHANIREAYLLNSELRVESVNTLVVITHFITP